MRIGMLHFLLFVLITNFSFAKESEFERQANLPFSDESTSWDIIQASDECFIGVGKIAMGSTGRTELTVTAIDKYGTVLWENTALSFGNSAAHSIVKFDTGGDGGFIVSCQSTSYYYERETSSCVFKCLPEDLFNWD